MSSSPAPANQTLAPTPAPAVLTPASALPQGIEIFMPGVRVDDSGRSHHFTPAMLAEIVASYNPAQHEAPLTIGHPKDNLPAYGWVAKLYINEAGNLAIDPAQADPEFVRMVADGRFKKRSASFHPPDHPANPTPGKWHLRHVAFLGAQPPAVKGLKDFKDGAGDVLVVSFSEDAALIPQLSTPPKPENPKENGMTDAEKLAAMQKQLAEKDAALAAAQTQITAAQAAADAANKTAADFAEAAAKQRAAEVLAFAEGQVKAGRVLPKDKGLLCAALGMVAAAEKPFEFAEGGTKTEHTAAQVGAWIRGLVSGANPAVHFGEFAPAGAGMPTAAPKTAEDMDKAIRQRMADKGCNYAEAAAHIAQLVAV